jgi:hypothetical protein
MGKYHGKLPPTSDDARMAMSHLVRTVSLDKKKVKEHEKQMKKSIKAGNKQSKDYNKSHLENHKDDIKEREQSIKTLRGIRGALKPLVSKT